MKPVLAHSQIDAIRNQLLAYFPVTEFKIPGTKVMARVIHNVVAHQQHSIFPKKVSSCQSNYLIASSGQHADRLISVRICLLETNLLHQKRKMSSTLTENAVPGTNEYTIQIFSIWPLNCSSWASFPNSPFHY